MRLPLLVGVVVAGFVAQLVDGTLGMGYGVTSTSLLLALGLTPAIASASVHVAEIGTSLAAGAAHWRYGNVHAGVLVRLALPGAVGAFAGAVALSHVSLALARPWVSVVLLVLGAVIVWRRVRGRRAIGTVSASEFVVSLAASAGFVISLGGTAVRWDVALVILAGSVVAAPVAAALVQRFDDAAFGAGIGVAIVVLNADRGLGLFGADPT